jgi:hypothetical protein
MVSHGKEKGTDMCRGTILVKNVHGLQGVYYGGGLLVPAKGHGTWVTSPLAM